MRHRVTFISPVALELLRPHRDARAQTLATAHFERISEQEAGRIARALSHGPLGKHTDPSYYSESAAGVLGLPSPWRVSGNNYFSTTNLGMQVGKWLALPPIADLKRICEANAKLKQVIAERQGQKIHPTFNFASETFGGRVTVNLTPLVGTALNPRQLFVRALGQTDYKPQMARVAKVLTDRQPVQFTLEM